MKAACIDIGSNSIRLLMPKEDKKINEKELLTTRLAEGFVDSGRISDAAMARTADAVSFFYRKAKKFGYDPVYVFATAAVRESINGSQFCSLLQKEGIDIDILDGETEAKLGYEGASVGRSGILTVFDIGGASTELVCGKDDVIHFAKSIPLGMVTLRDLAGTDKDVIETVVDTYALQFGITPPAVTPALYGIGGTATTLASMVLDLKTYDAEKTHECYVSRENLLSLENILFNELNLDEEKIFEHYPVIGTSRAKIIGHGIIMTKHILDMFGATGFTALETDNMEGYLNRKAKKS